MYKVTYNKKKFFLKIQYLNLHRFAFTNYKFKKNMIIFIDYLI